jgi:hypothetical protein
MASEDFIAVFWLAPILIPLIDVFWIYHAGVIDVLWIYCTEFSTHCEFPPMTCARVRMPDVEVFLKSSGSEGSLTVLVCVFLIVLAVLIHRG